MRKFSTHIAFLRNAFLGTLFSTNLSFLRNFILFWKIFYTYSVPTERLSRCSLFLQTFRSYGTLFYLGKFSTHIAFLRNAFLGVHYFNKPFVPMELYFILGKIFYTYSFPTERISRYSLFYKPIVPTELYYIWENFLHI